MSFETCVCVLEGDLRTCGETGRDRINHRDATADSRLKYAHLTHSHKHTTKPQHHCGMEMPQCLKIIATEWKYIEILLEDKDEETGVWKRDKERKGGNARRLTKASGKTFVCSVRVHLILGYLVIFL